jgi:uncharacterized protein YejL (UPF0352 family)
VLTTPQPVVEEKIAPLPTKLPDRQVQKKQLLTPIVLTFETPNDYTLFASGKLKTNLILKNTSSGQTKTIESIMLQENFRAAYRKTKTAKSMTIGLIIDDLIDPLMSAGDVKLSAESLTDDSGVNLILTYSGLGDRSPQNRTEGQPIKGIIVKGGRNPGGNIVAKAGTNQIITQADAGNLAAKSGVLVLQSSKGNGTPKAQGF